MVFGQNLNPTTCRMRIVHSGFFGICLRRGRRSRPPPWSFLVENKSVMKLTERTTCLYKNSLHLALAPLVGSVQAGAGLKAWSEEAAIRFTGASECEARRPFPLTSDHLRRCSNMIEKIAERSRLSIRRHEVALWPRLRFSPTSAGQPDRDHRRERRADVAGLAHTHRCVAYLNRTASPEARVK